MICYPAEALHQQVIPNWAMFLVIELDEAMRKRRVPKEWLPMIERRVRGLLEYFLRFENETGLLENWRAGCSANGSRQTNWGRI